MVERGDGLGLTSRLLLREPIYLARLPNVKRAENRLFMKKFSILSLFLFLSAAALGQVAVQQAPGNYTNNSVVRRDGTYNKVQNSGVIIDDSDGLFVPGVISAGSGPTTLTDTSGKILSAALNTVAAAQGGFGISVSSSSGVPVFTTGTPAFTVILQSQNGGTGNGFTKFTGPTTSEKTFTLPNVSETIGTLGQAQSWTGVQTFASASASSSPNTGALIVTSTGVGATSVGIGGGKIFTGGDVAVGGALTVTGTALATSFNGVALTTGGSSSAYLDGTGSYSTPAGGGNVSTSGTPSSGQAAEFTSSTAITGVAVTGTGSYVKSTSATLVTPTLGVASATSINKVAITAPATSATLTIANGKTLTANNTLTFAGTDSTTMTFPATTATIARTDAAQTFTGIQTMTSPAFTTSITTASTAFAAFNTTATTVNAFGAATTLNIGASAATVLNFGGATSSAEFRFLEPSGSGTNYTGFKAQAQGANITYTLPSTVGGAGTVLTDAAGNGTLSWGSAGAGTVSVVGAGSLTSTALVTGGGTTTLQTPSSTATMDSSGNISTPGSVTVGAGSSVAGAAWSSQGTAPTPPANSIGYYAPASVATAYGISWPATPATGIVLRTGSSNPQAETTIAPGTSGNVLTSNGTTWTSASAAGGGSYQLTANCAYYSPLASTTEYIGCWPASTPRGTDAVASFQIPKTGHITAVFASHRQDGGTIGSGGTNIPIISVMLAGANQASTAVNLNTASAASDGSVTGLNIAVTAGQTISFRIVNPAWTVSPTVLVYTATAVIGP